MSIDQSESISTERSIDFAFHQYVCQCSLYDAHVTLSNAPKMTYLYKFSNGPQRTSEVASSGGIGSYMKINTPQRHWQRSLSAEDARNSHMISKLQVWEHS